MNQNTSLQLQDVKMQEMLKAWKSKSLNSKSMQYYKIPTQTNKEQQYDTNKKGKGGLPAKSKNESKTEILPEPKIIKINQSVFCIYLYSKLMVFKLVNQLQKQTFKVRQQETFYPQIKSFQSTIKFVLGNNSNYIYVGFQRKLHIYKIKFNQQKDQSGKLTHIYNGLEQIQIKEIQNLKGLGFIRQLQNDIQMPILVILTNQKIIKYNLNRIKQKPIQQAKIVFSPKQQSLYNTFKQVNTIQILCQNNINMYFFGTKEGISITQQSSQKNKREKKCQYLYLMKFNLDVKNGETIQPMVNIIDHVFQIGIFSKSKIFQLGPSIFLISLYQEIILVKYHFENFVVWDNISMVSSKSIEKKGQLILADKIVMVYTQMGQIFAHNIFFSFKQSKLKYPRIDNFKGNDNDQQILYDAIVLEYQQGSFMKVLFYFKQADVYTPSHKIMIHKEDKMMGDQRQLQCAVRCIQQNDPLIKLAKLFKDKKPPNQIAEFVQRFSIDELNKSKCEWSVSQKSEKDIESLLLSIKSNEYIQNQLTQILKSNPHQLKFLSKIQKKQNERYKQMLAVKMLKNDQDSDPQKLSLLYNDSKSYFSKAEVQQIKQIIKWVIESMMFQKKLAYEKNFLDYMEYQFIDIGKLKAASLRQQIKLLSCKGYQKRLKYFLNSFKYMILANFENIFLFLIEDKNVQQIEKFFISNFPFILPQFQETSQIYKKKADKHTKQMRQMRARRDSFGMVDFKFPLQLLKPKKQKQQEKCLLWQDKFDNSEQIRKIETKQSFKKQIYDQISITYDKIIAQQKEKRNNNNMILKQCLQKQKAQKQFAKIFDQFMRQRWFLQNRSKQHSIIQCSIQQLKEKMKYLKRIGVFHLLIRFFYSKIRAKKYDVTEVDNTLKKFQQAKLIPQSFRQNILARRAVYEIINQSKKQLPLLENFLIEEETDYFNYLFQNFRGLLLKQIKNVYDNDKTIGIPGLFKQKFQIYLNSDRIVLSAVIDFLDQFQGNINDDIRLDVFTCIKKLLLISDKQNTASFVNKLMEKEILNHQGSGMDSLIDEAKIAFGYYFFQFFKLFNINETYTQLIAETGKQEYIQCKILQQILQKYCKQEYNQDNQEQTQGFIKFQERFGLQELLFSIVQDPLQFFGIILYLIDTLRFSIKPQIVFDKFVQLLLLQQSYIHLVDFIQDFRERIGGQTDPQFQYENQEFNQRHYQLLKQFYEEEGTTMVQDRLIDNILIYSRKLYKDLILRILPSSPDSHIKKLSEKTIQQITSSFEKVLKTLELENSETVRQKSFLQMLGHVLSIEPKLLNFILKARFQNVNQDNLLYQQSQLLNKLSCFRFMIKLLKTIPQKKFRKINQNLSINYKNYYKIKEQLQKSGYTLTSESIIGSSFKQKQQQITNAENSIKVEIYAFECIYTKFQFTSRFDYSKSSKQEKQFGLIRFYMELSMKLIKDKSFFYAYQVIINIINKEYYFRDVFYCFMASIQQNGSKQKFTQFIRSFIQTTHQQTLTKLFTSYIKQNKIISFQGQLPIKQDQNQKQQQDKMNQETIDKNKKNQHSSNNQSKMANQKNKKTSEQKIGFTNRSEQNNDEETSELTIIIFQCLLQSKRIDEAYYFLVRNQLLSVDTAFQIKINNNNTQNYALISTYMKCLKEFLCEQFYPTFNFYRDKLEALNNSFERKAIIKDIKYAISNLRQKVSQQKLKQAEVRLQQNDERNLEMSMNIVGNLIQSKLTIQGQNEDSQKKKKRLEDQKQKRKIQIQKIKAQINKLQVHLSQLTTFYTKYMYSIGQEATFKLDQEQVRQYHKQNKQFLHDSLRGHEFHYRINPPDQQLFNNGIGQKRTIDVQQLKQKQINQDQEKKLQQQKKKIKESPVLMQLQKQINHQIKQTKMLGEKYEKDVEQQAKKPQPKSSKMQKAYNQLKQKQKSDLGSIKQSYKSQTAERVNQFLQQMRLRKSKIYEKSQAKSRIQHISELDRNSQVRSRKNSDAFYHNPAHDLMSPPNLMVKHQRQMSGVGSDHSNVSSNKYEVKIRDVNGITKDMYLPVTMTEQKLVNSKVSMNNYNNNRKQEKDIYPKYQSQVSVSNNNKNLIRSQVKPGNTIQQLIKLFEQKQPQCKKYIQKLEIVKNNVQVGLQLTKNIYSSINNFEVFIKYLGFLLQNYPNYKQVIQEKAYKIASQAMGIESKINLKQLFPMQLFIKVINVSIKQYYKTAYQILRPSLLKILSKPETNVHGIAIFYRFGFGSENIYYFRVYQDYIRILIKTYNQQQTDQKKLFMLSQKLRTLYSNINTQNRQSKFEQLMKQVTNQNKRKMLIKQMLKVLQRRAQMLTGEKQTDLKDVLLKLC